MLARAIGAVVLAFSVPAFSDGRVELVTRGAFSAPMPSDGNSTGPRWSSDGRYLVFASSSTSFGVPDTNGFTDVYLLDRATDTFSLLSRDGVIAADANSASPAISADGGRVAFTSAATTLPGGDANVFSDIFVLERASGALTRITPAPGVEPDGDAFELELSGDGRWLAFKSSATNWVAGDTNAAEDVFVVDLAAAPGAAGRVERASIGNAGEQLLQPDFNFLRNFDFSEHGRCVAFATPTPLEAGESPTTSDVYLRDLDADTTTRITVGALGEANGPSGAPVVSPDCTKVAFATASSNLTADPVNYFSAVLEKTLAGGTFARVWPPVAEPPGEFDVASITASRNGEYLALAVFRAAITMPTQPSISLWRRSDGFLFDAPASVTGEPGAVLGDGTLVAYETYAPIDSIDRNAYFDLALYDPIAVDSIPLTQRRTVLSATTGNGASGIAERGTYLDGQFRQQFVSDDGLLVAYSSIATNLAAGDDNGREDAYIADRRTGTHQRISAPASGAEPNGESMVTDMSADGRYVVIESCATNLVAGDTNGACDVFVTDRTAVPRTFERVNVASDGTAADRAGPFNGGHWGSVSADGRYVAFASDATNLVAGDTNNRTDIFLRDRTAGTTVLLSRATGVGAPVANGFSQMPRISADGRFVSFRSTASNLVAGVPGGQLWVVDTTSFALENVSVTSEEVAVGALSSRSFISSDGRYVAFLGNDSVVPGDTDGMNDVFVRDRLLGKTTIASLRPDGTHWTVSTFLGGLSARGQLLPFIVDEDDSFGGASYAYDISTGKVDRISAAPPGFSQSLRPAASSNARFVAVAHNGVLVPADQNGSIYDIYVASDFVTGIEGGAEGASPELALQGADVADAEMGEAVAVSDTYIVAGAPGVNEVYVYERPAGATGTTMMGRVGLAKSTRDFTLVATLPAPGGGTLGDKWGAAVAISPDGSVIAIGAPGVGAGQVAVFERPGSGDWTDPVDTPQLINAANTGAVVPGDFGTALDIGEDGRLVVGAPTTEVQGQAGAGMVQVYVPDSNLDYAAQGDAMVAPAVQAGAGFGMDVAISARAIAVGAPLEDDGGNGDEGAVYTYGSSGGDPFQASATIRPPDGGEIGGKWGMGVGLGPNTLAIGSPGADTDAGTDAGTGYVYQSPDDTFGTATPSELRAARPGAGEQVGSSVEVAGDYVAIGAPLSDRLGVADTGTAHVFERPETGWATRPSFTADIELRASESQQDQQFATALALSRQGIVAGVPLRDVAARPNQGEADTFVFDRISRAGFE